MRRRSVVIGCLVAVLVTAGLVVGYQRVSALTCSTPAFAAWVGEGNRGTRACLLYLALAPDTPPVRAGAAPAAAPAAAPSSPAPSPTGSPVSDSVREPGSAPATASSPPTSTAAPEEPPTSEGLTPDGELIFMDTCRGRAFVYWQEVAQCYGDDASCQAYDDAITETAAENPEMLQPDPSFRCSETSQEATVHWDTRCSGRAASTSSRPSTTPAPRAGRSGGPSDQSPWSAPAARGAWWWPAG